MVKETKYLIKRNNIYWYHRKVPVPLREILNKTFSRHSLKTDDLSIAKKRRDMIIEADNGYWAELKAGRIQDSAHSHYERVLARAKSLNIHYRSSEALANDLNIEELLARINLLEAANKQKSKVSIAALTGALDTPEHIVSDVLKLYVDKIMSHDLTKKNEAQKARWLTTHERIIRNFISVCGDLAFKDISRTNTLAYRDYFQARVLDTDLTKRITAGAANREIGTLAVMFKRYFKYLGKEVTSNPFSDLKFKEDVSQKRPHFEIVWIKNLLTTPDITSSLNSDARDILFATVETGMRPIEICNILPENICIDTDFPYVNIEPRDGYELKTNSSRRIIPLVGVSLAAFKRIKNNRQNRYIAKSNQFSAVTNKHFKKNGLFEVEKQSVYSMRHSFKKRMVEAKIDEEMRDILMGHASDRPEYGDGGSIEFKTGLLSAMSFDYDDAIFKDKQ